MKNLKKIIIGIGLVMNQSYADDVILKEPGYGGNGCPSGSAAIFYSKKRSLSFVFDDIDVEAGPMVKKIVARKSCNIAIPVDASQGYQFRLKSISSLKGLFNLPEKAMARFSSEVFFAGERGPRYRKSFKGPLEKDYKIKFANHHPWSRCGRDKNLRLNFSLLLKNKNLEKPAKAILSTEGGLTFDFEVRPPSGEGDSLNGRRSYF